MDTVITILGKPIEQNAHYALGYIEESLKEIVQTAKASGCLTARQRIIKSAEAALAAAQRVR